MILSQVCLSFFFPKRRTGQTLLESRRQAAGKGLAKNDGSIGSDQTVIRILFVCHGNICRSPMAEFVLRDMVERQGWAERVAVESAATSTEEIGNPVHPGTREKLRQAGISCQGKRARQIRPEDYERFDWIVGMDDWNMRNLRRMFPGDPKGKLHKMLDFCGTGSDVADPWYTGNFDATWQDVQRGCRAMMKQMEKELTKA